MIAQAEATEAPMGAVVTGGRGTGPPGVGTIVCPEAWADPNLARACDN